MKYLEHVVYQTRNGIKPFPIAAFMSRAEAQEYLGKVSTHSGPYQFYIEKES